LKIQLSINLARALACASLAYWVLNAIVFAAPDEDVLGKNEGYPVPPRATMPIEEKYKVGLYSNRDKLSPHCEISPSSTPFLLKKKSVNQSFRYQVDGLNLTIDDYVSKRQRATGLMVIKDEQVLYEYYGYNLDSEKRLLSSSMAKTIVALAVGQTLNDGHIKSLSDKVTTYLPSLDKGAFSEARIIDLLRMSSGVEFSELNNGQDDLSRLHAAISRDGTVAAIQTLNRTVFSPGEKFRYASVDTKVLALLIRAATKKTLCEYVSERIWKPIGAQSTATWIINANDGVELGEGLFNATLPDFARLAIALANDGRIDGRQVFNKEFILDMTDASRQPPQFQPRNATDYFGYGYQTWIFPSPTGQRRFAMQGIYGQAIFVDPSLKLAVVHTAVAKSPSGSGIIRELDFLWRGIVGQYGRW
jgi:CubicO group peptidase (beta-lactamase class C family)